MANKQSIITELKSIHILRFLLSLSVIIHHYRAFPDVFKCNKGEKCFPSYKYLHIIAAFGQKYAVATFWFISGVIFSKLYEEPIRERFTSFKQYMVNRFSRLYPLHFVTLLITACLQYFIYKAHKRFFIYSNNTPKAFMENLVFTHSWKNPRQYSFNAPSWSLGVEIKIYILFFFLSNVGLMRSLFSTTLVWWFFSLCSTAKQCFCKRCYQPVLSTFL